MLIDVKNEINGRRTDQQPSTQQTNRDSSLQYYGTMEIEKIRMTNALEALGAANISSRGETTDVSGGVSEIQPQQSAEKNNNDDASSPKKEDSSSGSTTSDCPLFMDGLPSNFAQNSSLAAIASLLNDDDQKEGKECNKKTVSQSNSSVHLQSGGGKVKKTTGNKHNNHNPYSKDKNSTDNGGKDKKKASLGEAQLFMNMWKL